MSDFGNFGESDAFPAQRGSSTPAPRSQSKTQVLVGIALLVLGVVLSLILRNQGGEGNIGPMARNTAITLIPFGVLLAGVITLVSVARRERRSGD